MQSQPLNTVQATLKALDAYGINLPQLLSSLSIPFHPQDPVNSVSLRIDDKRYLELQRTLNQAYVAEKRTRSLFGPAHFRYMCYGLIHCHTLGEAIQRSMEFYSLFPERFGQLLLEPGDTLARYRVIHDQANTEPLNAGRAYEWSRLLVFYGWLIRKPFPLRQVEFAYTITAETLEKLVGLFQVPVLAETAETAFVFDNAILDEPLRQTEATLQEFLQQSQQAKGPSFSYFSLHDQILAMVEHQFNDSFPPCSELAATLHMSESKLRRQLARENTSYRDIRDTYLRQRASDLLLNSNIPVGAIADMLGFAEPVTFQRAFKRWTGMNPRQFRQQHSGATGGD